MSEKKTTKADRGRTRPTIGLLMTGFAREFHRAAWSGIADATLEQGVNLICFDGGILRTPEGFDAQGNVLYDLVGAERIDGLIVWTSILDWAVEPEEMEAFCRHYHPLPTVSVGRMVEGIPSVLVDNYQGIREEVSHLVEVHGCRRVAFLRGPKGSEEEELRYRAYADVLAEHGITLDPTLVTPYSGWERVDGHSMIRLLLDERKVDFEAIVAANDSLALGALEELRAQGIRAPQEVAVAGFDDVEETRATVLSLTTVRQPLDEVGRQAVESVLAMIQGEQVPKQVTVPLQLIVRRSCGCQSPAVTEAATGLKRRSASSKSWAAALTAGRASVLSDMVQAAGTHPGDVVPPDEAERILDSFIAEMKGQSPGTFLAEWEDVLRRAATAGGKVSVWEGVLSALRRRVLPYLEGELLSQAEDLWQQSRVLVEETAVQARTYANFLAGQRDRVLREIDQILITSPGIEELMNVIAQELPRLGIPSCYLSLYENPEKSTEWAGLALAYDEKGRAGLQEGERRFLSSQLVPEGMLPQERQYNLMVEPLYFRENQLGFALFEVGQRDVSIYDVLRGQISGALQVALLLQEHGRGEEALAEERNLLRTLIDSLPDSVYVKDTESRFLVANVEAARRVGVATPDDLVGKTDMELYPERLATGYSTDEQEVFRSGQPLINREELVIDQTTGERIWNLATKVPLRDSQGEIVALVGIGRNITERKLAEETLERRSAQLQTAAEVARAASGILDPDRLIRQVVALVHERFGLYYTGLFLVDQTGEWTGEPGRWAVLRAGTGEAGQEMLEQGHKLEIGGSSMIGWCVANKQARIALDVGEEAIRFENPLLQETRSELALPLTSRGEVIGALTIQSALEAAFSDEDIAALQTLAGQVANAIENARLFEQTQLRAEEMVVLNELSQALSTHLSVQDVLKEVYQGASRLLDAANFYIALYDPDAHEVTFPFETTEDEEDLVPALSADRGLTGYVIRHRASLLIEENVPERMAEMGIDVIGKSCLSWLGAPMVAGDQVLGMLGVQSFTTPRAYNEHDRDLLVALANQTANALANARLFEQAQAALQEMEAVQRRYLQRVWSEYVRTREVGGYEQTDDGLLPLDDTLLPEVRQALQEQHAVVLDGGDGVSVLVVPVILRGQSLGALGFRIEGGPERWSSDDIALAEAVGEQFALAAENLRLLDETQRRAARERLTSEVTTRMRETLDVERVLRTATDEIYQALGPERVVVRLEMAEDGAERKGPTAGSEELEASQEEAA
jgi:PAS domain S-box-containing protein